MSEVRWEPSFFTEMCPECMARSVATMKRILNSYARTVEELGADEFPREEVVKMLRTAADGLHAVEVPDGPR